MPKRFESHSGWIQTSSQGAVDMCGVRSLANHLSLLLVKGTQPAITSWAMRAPCTLIVRTPLQQLQPQQLQLQQQQPQQLQPPRHQNQLTSVKARGSVPSRSPTWSIVPGMQLARMCHLTRALSALALRPCPPLKSSMTISHCGTRAYLLNSPRSRRTVLSTAWLTSRKRIESRSDWTMTSEKAVEDMCGVMSRLDRS